MGDTVGDAVGDCVGDVVGDDVGDVVGEDVGASDVQHVSAHSSATLDTPHWFVWRRKLQLGGERQGSEECLIARIPDSMFALMLETLLERMWLSVVQRLCTQLRNTRYVALVRLR